MEHVNKELYVIIDKIMMFAILMEAPIHYLYVVLEILSFYWCKLKLQKTILLGPVWDFLVIETWYKRNTLAEANQP